MYTKYVIFKLLILLKNANWNLLFPRLKNERQKKLKKKIPNIIEAWLYLYYN